MFRHRQRRSHWSQLDKLLLQGPNDASQWEKIRYYAKFVRRLEHEQRDNDDPIYERLLEEYQDQPLLPNLQEMWWRQLGFIHKEHTLFLSPGLLKFRFYEINPVTYNEDNPNPGRNRSINDEELFFKNVWIGLRVNISDNPQANFVRGFIPGTELAAKTLEQMTGVFNKSTAHALETMAKWV